MKPRSKNILITGLLLLGIGVIFGFSKQKKAQTTCWSFELEVDHSNGHFFVDENGVRTALANSGIGILGAPTNEIDLGAVKELVENEPSVKEAEIYISADGMLKAKITQRNPILRIMNSDGSSFYLDEEGETFPLSQDYTAKVMVATGELTEGRTPTVKNILKDANLASSRQLDDLFEIANYVYHNPFWDAQIDHIVAEDGAYTLIPRVGNHRIFLGDAGQTAEKLAKLKVFYNKTIGTYDLNQYKSINLQYQDQVVCTRW